MRWQAPAPDCEAIVHKPALTAFFDSSRRASRRLVLVMVTGTAGSTYSKAGDCMLIDDRGRYQGLLSGGCLEGDLALRAATVIAAGGAEALRYDLAADDELWGLGIGCDGRIDVHADPARRRRPAVCGDERRVRRTRVGAYGCGARGPGLAARIHRHRRLQRDALPCRTRRGLALEQRAPARCDSRIQRRRQASPRALPVAGAERSDPRGRSRCRAGTATGARARLAHDGCRSSPAYLESDALAIAGARHRLVPAELGAALDLHVYDAAVVMSHHLASDRAYLDALAPSSLGYVGLLGPAARRDRLLTELGERAERLAGRLEGPVGLDLGGPGGGSDRLVDYRWGAALPEPAGGV